MININIRLDKFNQVKKLSDRILCGVEKGNLDYVVHIKDSFTRPNVCAPIAGIIEYYRNNGVKIIVDCPKKIYANRVGIDKPILSEDIDIDDSPFGKVYSFSSVEGVSKIVNIYLLALRQGAELEHGVIQSMEWCMNETIDNVLQHSMSEKGFVMAQLNEQKKSFSFCIFDSGIGIYNSLLTSKHKPKDPLDAIKLSLQERITRDEKIGQGNGLWGLIQIIKETKGTLTISSGGARYEWLYNTPHENPKGDYNLGKHNGTTMIYYSIDYSSPIDIANALNKHELVDLWAENHENDAGDIEINVAKEISSTGTRQAAQRLRNIVVNFLKDGYSTVNLDFIDVSMLSSSFADELIGKLIASLGFSKFMHHITISNLNEYNSLIVNRSVGLRMAQIYMDEKINESEES